METNIGLNEVEVKKPSLFGMITSPSIQFNRMKERAPLGLPLIMMMLIMAVTGALVSYISLNNPEVKQLSNAQAFTIPPGLTIGMGAIGGLIGGTAMFFISAVIYKIFMMIMGNDTPYKKLVSIVIYTSIITSLGLLINCLIALALGRFETTYTSLAPLVGDNKAIKAIASAFDIFQIWYYVVMAMGLHIAAGLSKNKAVATVVILFIISLAFSLLTSLLPQINGM